MKSYRIPATNLDVSRLAYGTWHLGGSWDQTPLSDDLKQRADKLINTAVDQGINFIDLADIYTMGKSDEAVGHVLKNQPKLRDKIYLQAKAGIILGADPVHGGPQRYDFSYDHLVGSVEKTLQLLNTEYVDVLTLHRPDPLMDPEEVGRAFDHLNRSGKVRYFGVSNFNGMQIALLQNHIDHQLIINQVELNLLHNHLIVDGIMVNSEIPVYAGAGKTMDYCRLNDMLIQAWSPVAGGRVFDESDEAPENVRQLARTIREMAHGHNTTTSAIALAWLLRHPAGIQPIVGSLNADRIIESCQADEVELSRQEWYTLLAAARGADVP